MRVREHGLTANASVVIAGLTGGTPANGTFTVLSSGLTQDQFQYTFTTSQTQTFGVTAAIMTDGFTLSPGGAYTQPQVFNIQAKDVDVVSGLVSAAVVGNTTIFAGDTIIVYSTATADFQVMLGNSYQVVNATTTLIQWYAPIGDYNTSSSDIFEFGGRAAQTATQIRSFADEMGVTVDDTSLGNYVDRVFAGEQNIEDIQNAFRESAAAYLPQFASRIKAGETVKSIVSPYRDMIASYLEIDSNEIGYGLGANSKADPLLNRALFGTDGKAMSLYDVQKTIKQDARWQKTSNARDEYTQLTKNLLRSFGVGV
jgi:hypothetical protein